MKRILWVILGPVAFLLGVVAVPYAIYHDLHPAPQPVAPTNAPASLVYTSSIPSAPPDETNFLWLTNIYAHDAPSFSAELLVNAGSTPLLSLRSNGEPIVDVATNGEVTLYVPVSEASKEFWCLLSKWAQEERAFLAQHPLDSILWTNRAPAWNLDLPPSGSTNSSDPFNPRP